MSVNTDSKVRWAIADLEFFPNNGDRYEIIDGDLYVTRAPHWRHQNVLMNLAESLPKTNAAGQAGKIFQTPGLVFGGTENAIPDLVWISREKLEACEDEAGHFTAAPELVVEVLSKMPQDISRDRQIKLKLYSRVGVQEYWIIDWRQKTVEIYRRSQVRLMLVCTLFAEDELTSPLFTDLQIKVANLFD